MRTLPLCVFSVFWGVGSWWPLKFLSPAKRTLFPPSLLVNVSFLLQLKFGYTWFLVESRAPFCRGWRRVCSFYGCCFASRDRLSLPDSGASATECFSRFFNSFLDSQPSLPDGFSHGPQVLLPAPTVLSKDSLTCSVLFCSVGVLRGVELVSSSTTVFRTGRPGSWSLGVRCFAVAPGFAVGPLFPPKFFVVWKLQDVFPQFCWCSFVVLNGRWWGGVVCFFFFFFFFLVLAWFDSPLPTFAV